MNETRAPMKPVHDPLAVIRGALAQAIFGIRNRGGLNVARGSHSRRFTKLYADGRQKRGGKLWRTEQIRLGR